MKKTAQAIKNYYSRTGLGRMLGVCVALAAIFVLVGSLARTTVAQAKYDRRLIEKVEVIVDGGQPNLPVAEPFLMIVKDRIGASYSAPRIHDTIEALYRTNKVAEVKVTASPNGATGVDLIFAIRRKRQADKVSIVLGKFTDKTITEQELLFKLDLLSPGTTITEQTLRNNADQILDYLRERGYYRSEVTFEQTPLQGENSVAVVFTVAPGEQAKVEEFKIDIAGLDRPIPPKTVKLAPGTPFTREALARDISALRAFLRKQDLTAPELDDPRVTYDSDKNAITIGLLGKVGPKVKITVESDAGKVSNSTLDRILPLKREGTLDYAAIVEGERRLENYFQEKGYFFANVTPVCSIEPPLAGDGIDAIPNNSEVLCSNLGTVDLEGRTVTINYKANANRKLRLLSLRLRGTDRLPLEEIRTVLESQEANLLGIIPLFGYGRGFTSLSILERDASTIRSLINELGYRDAQVRVIQGVSPNGEDLIITFQVEDGPPSIVEDVSISGNKAFAADTLLAKVPNVKGREYSRARVRNAVKELAEFYSKEGYYDARVSSSVVEDELTEGSEKRTLKVEFKVESEGRRVVINRVLVNGVNDTKPRAILKASKLKPGQFLRAADVYGTEQSLYATDAFDRVEIKTQPAGDTAGGDRASDVIISVNEQRPRLLTYGGGFSTDLGANGFFDIRHVNLLGNLWQGGARMRWSQRQQLVQFDFINPRFLSDGDGRFAPLTFSAQYQRDSTVTRFFRSAFDKGTFGVVQRVDANGTPIDIFGNATGSPTINRLSIAAETSRTLSRKNRSIIFGRYRFEDVRLSNIESLLIKDLLTPDARVRISGFGFTYVRDTRENCSARFSLLELIAKGEPGDKCRYNASDPTRGSYITAEYNVSIPQLGANIGFQKFQASYNFYYTFPKLKNTTIAGRAILGLATVFSASNRFNNAQFPDLNNILPVSERFFAGGANTLRGFDFEEAGPRVVIVPQGTFLNSAGNIVYLTPFTVPFGGNALAVINLEARVPVSKSIRFVPFYDGGNVFRRIGDIFNPPDVPANDVFRQNLRALWTHTVGIGLRLKTPIGGEFAVDYGRLLNPPRFQIPQTVGPNAIYQLRQDQIHFRFSQAF